ncbi:MAG TPA: hypothetical protein VGS27_02625 [Candidatus Sulfotelmatobacter sp.]|nr:hypothetical protein [Candidatus Sulfotelmatobacter sp.]
MTRRGLFALVVLLFSSIPSIAQPVKTKKMAKQSSTQALTYAAQAMAALTGGNAITDVTLTGTGAWTLGPETDNGNATFLASGTNESRMDLTLSSGTRTEIRDAQTGTRIGEWIAPNQSSGMFAYHNCVTDAVWFFPALGSLAGGSNIVFTYIGQETRNGQSVQHIQSYQPSSTALGPSGFNPQQLSVMDFYLDSVTFLPSSITFNVHPDNDSASNLLVEIDFSNYQTVNGFSVPMHIQKYLQGTLLIDLTVSTAAFNTGIPLSEFAIN